MHAFGIIVVPGTGVSDMPVGGIAGGIGSSYVVKLMYPVRGFGSVVKQCWPRGGASSIPHHITTHITF